MDFLNVWCSFSGALCCIVWRNVFVYWSLFLYSAILRSWADSLRSHVILHEWIAFYSAFLNIHRSGVLTALAWLVPQESAARESQSRRVLCTPYNHALCQFMQSYICKVYACLAVTCHLRFWQNDRGLLRATAVTRGVLRVHSICSSWYSLVNLAFYTQSTQRQLRKHTKYLIFQKLLKISAWNFAEWLFSPKGIVSDTFCFPVKKPKKWVVLPTVSVT